MTDTRRQIFTADARLTFAKADGDKPAMLTGYAIVWDALSDDRGGYKVRFKKGSPTFTTPTMAYYHHDPRAILGNTANGSLRLSQDDVGVRVEIDLPDTSTARDVQELVGKKYIGGMSFAMIKLTDYVTSKENGVEIMNVTAFTCDEVTVTGIPSFTATSIAVAQDPPALPMAASKNSTPPAKDRAAQWGKLQQIKLAALAEIQG
jgi:HK97 family phage prohead protease